MNKLKKTGVYLATFCVGVVLWNLFEYRAALSVVSAIQWIYEKVGITIIGLVPLTVWGVYTALRNSSVNGDLTLSYIATTSQRLGLLGTVIGIVAATLEIGNGLESGAATAVTGALPAVGQALISTAVGFCIAMLCEFFRYQNYLEANNAKEPVK